MALCAGDDHDNLISELSSVTMCAISCQPGWPRRSDPATKLWLLKLATAPHQCAIKSPSAWECRHDEALAAGSWQAVPRAAGAATDTWLWWTQAQAALASGDTHKVGFAGHVTTALAPLLACQLLGSSSLFWVAC
jgi:hypothetical protein